MENSRTCGIRNVDVHGASYAKHLGSKKHLEIMLHDEMIISERLFKENQSPIKINIKKVYTPKH